MKAKIKAKVPKLKEMCEQFLKELKKPEYYQDDSPLNEMEDLVEANEL